MKSLLSYYNRETFAELFKIAAPMMVSPTALTMEVRSAQQTACHSAHP